MPAPQREEILVHVTVAGVNPVDWKVAEGKAGEQRHFPLILGQDFAGIAERLGESVQSFKPGDRVFGVARTYGAYSEYTVVPEHSQEEPVAPIPAGLSDEQAAALPTAGLTALAALAAASLMHDAKLVILGATGGVGGFATQIAHQRGIRVIATVHSGKEELARSLGAQEIIPYDHADTVSAIRAMHPDGVDAVIDLVSNRDQIRAFVDVIRSGGRIVSTIGALDEDWFSKRGIVAHNIVVARTPQSSRESLELLAQMVLDGQLRVDLADVKPLADADEALNLSKSGNVSGKLVLTV
ncbi:MAG TPA: NADP-dependent oxidoreductase [Candidatus Acidoferrales bacterium]|nr:NADP-dependent oxidoreductase [Candidatus Acidoferrales bacterium]